jgi:hypothetical protein
MLHQDVRGRMTFAATQAPSDGGTEPVRQSAARLGAALARLLLAPLALLAAAAAGLLFAVLLPICGIATIAEGIAKASWRFVRETFARLPHPPARRI